MSESSPTTTYTVSLPPEKMNFNHSISENFMNKEYESVHSKGISMFLEIEKSLEELEKRCVHMPLDIHGTNKEFTDILKMLNQEKSRFEDDIQNAIKNKPEDNAPYKTLSLNRVRMDLLLESCTWDQRLCALQSSDIKQTNSDTGIDQGSIWAPFSDIRSGYMENLQRGYLPKIESCGSYAKESMAQKLISEEGSRQHIPLCSNDYIVSDYENEFSSIIACALALVKDAANATEVTPVEISKGFGKDPGKHKYSVVCVLAREFRLLRDLCCPEVEYIASLSRCTNLDTEDGTGKSFVAKTVDNRFIVREIKRAELDSFMKLAGNYFNYMNQTIKSGYETCLAKILGIYQVVVTATNGKESKHNLIVTENLSSGRQMEKQYNLKGACPDQSFINNMTASPLSVSRESKRRLQQAVFNDTSFLHTSNVTDYSLLVGVDTQHSELVCGIVDYLKCYTWDKQLENWIKSPFLPNSTSPAILPPKEYKKKIRTFVDTYVLSLPDDTRD